MLPGPPSRSNGGGADCSAAGLLAYAAGSSVVIADPRSMQLVCVLPLPFSSSSASSPPFVTSVRWTPHPLSRDISDDTSTSASHLRLAVGDRQGRIALWDLRSRQISQWLLLPSRDPSAPKLGIQDMCWLRSSSSTWLLASIHGPSLLSLWNADAGRCLWKYDSSPEYLSCLRLDPFDCRHLCALGLRGFLLSAIVLSDGTAGDPLTSSGAVDVSIQDYRIPVDSADLHRLERESSSSSPGSPALSVFPLYFARFCFFPRWRHVLVLAFPKELVVFDLQYGTTLSSVLLPRGCYKFMDLITDPNGDLLHCVHLDGKLSTWKRKE